MSNTKGYQLLLLVSLIFLLSFVFSCSLVSISDLIFIQIVNYVINIINISIINDNKIFYRSNQEWTPTQDTVRKRIYQQQLTVEQREAIKMNDGECKKEKRDLA